MGGGTNSSNEILDTSVPFGSRVLAGDVSKANISAVFPRDARHQPGALGIQNHGNTCFMNAIIQCLSNTEFFVDYFLSGDYRKSPSRQSGTLTNGDLNRSSNRVNTRYIFSEQNGEQNVRVGSLTERLARLLKSLWACQYKPEISCGFKAIVGEYGSQYEGTAQNDSQEFLLWLLDKLHEDRIGGVSKVSLYFT